MGLHPHFRRPAATGPLGQPGQAVTKPGVHPGVSGGVAHSEEVSQLAQRLASVVAQNCLGTAALARMPGVEATSFERLHFLGG